MRSSVGSCMATLTWLENLAVSPRAALGVCQAAAAVAERRDDLRAVRDRAVDRSGLHGAVGRDGLRLLGVRGAVRTVRRHRGRRDDGDDVSVAHAVSSVRGLHLAPTHSCSC